MFIVTIYIGYINTYDTRNSKVTIRIERKLNFFVFYLRRALEEKKKVINYAELIINKNDDGFR